MLPIFCASRRGHETCLKPVLQVIFETLFDSASKNFCLIVGRGKRAVEDYFTVDETFLTSLLTNRKRNAAAELSDFYRRIRGSSIAFVNQHKSRGFGDAVLCARSFVGEDPFLLHAGDDLIISPGRNHITRLKKAFRSTQADAVFFVERTAHPEKYGVVRVEKQRAGVYRVKELVEKPRVPPSNLGVIAIYALQPIVFEYLEKVKPDRNGEVQLADAIQAMVEDRRKVFALSLHAGERRIDIGTPDAYRLALRLTL